MRKYLLWLAAALLAGSLEAAEHKFDFSTAPLNEAPPGCFNTLAGTGKPGTWKVIMDEVPLAPSPLNPNGPGVARQSVVAQVASDITDEHFPMLVLGNDSYGDFTFHTRFKIVDGVTEQMAGVAFRIQDERNYYYVRASALGSNFLFYTVRDGVRLEPPIGKDISIEKGVWHDLSIECTHTRFHILLDGKEAMPSPFFLNDDHYSSGKIAFLTKSDSICYFTDAKVTYTPKEPFIQMLVRDTLKDYPRLLGLKVFVMPPKSTQARVIASDDEKEIGQLSAGSAADVINRGIPYYGKEKEKVFVTLPLRDRNGDCVAAVRVVLKRVAGQTEENARYRALPVVKKMQERVSAVDSILE